MRVESGVADKGGGFRSARTIESHYCRKREDSAIKEVLRIVDPEISRVADRPLTDNEQYIPGYAYVRLPELALGSS